jgi:hypothetical protein
LGDVGEERETVSDLETLKAMLAKAPGGYYQGGTVSVDTKSDAAPKVMNGGPPPEGSVEVTVERGYGGFVAVFLFDKDGTLLDVAAYE